MLHLTNTKANRPRRPCRSDACPADSEDSVLMVCVARTPAFAWIQEPLNSDNNKCIHSPKYKLSPSSKSEASLAPPIQSNAKVALYSSSAALTSGSVIFFLGRNNFPLTLVFSPRSASSSWELSSEPYTDSVPSNWRYSKVLEVVRDLTCGV